MLRNVKCFVECIAMLSSASLGWCGGVQALLWDAVHLTSFVCRLLKDSDTLGKMIHVRGTPPPICVLFFLCFRLRPFMFLLFCRL